MNLYHLRYFVTLAHLEHYTQAAEVLGITQPSLSHAMAALEEELGVSLFEKEGRNVILSKWGRQFLADVEASLVILDRGVTRMQKLGQGQGVIDLCFLRGLGADLVPKLISAFQKTAAGQAVEFHLSTAATWEMLDGLESQRYDLAFCSHDATAKHIRFVPVETRPFYLVVPETHPLASRTSIDLEETLDEPHILFAQSAAIRTEIDQIYAGLSRMPKIAYEVQEAQDIAGLVANQFGIAVLQKSYFLSSLPVKVIPLAHQTVQSAICLASSQRHLLSPAAQAFWDFVLEYRKG